MTDAVTYVLAEAVVNASLVSAHRVPRPAVTNTLFVSGTSWCQPLKEAKMFQ